MSTTLHWEQQFGRLAETSVDRHVLDGDGQPHDHDFMELVTVLGGQGLHSSGWGEMRLMRGSAILIRPYHWHAYLSCESLELVNFCFPITAVRSEWRNLLDPSLRSLLRSGKGVQFVHLPDSTLEAIRLSEGTHRNACGALGLILWALDQFALVAPAAVSPSHPAVEQAANALEQRPDLDWNATSLAKSVGLDRAYLSRLFQAELGLGSMSYLALIRMERAASLLRHSDLNCGEIALTVGYADPNLFSRRFRSAFGISPTGYRARNRDSILKT